MKVMLLWLLPIVGYCQFPDSIVCKMVPNHPKCKIPVVLVGFTITQDGLIWATASERDNDYFTIEHSTDGVNWQEVGKVTGSATSLVINTYRWYGEHEGRVYYKLSQTDFDGNRTELSVKSGYFPSYPARYYDLLGRPSSTGFLIVIKGNRTYKIYKVK